jgi:hypothetical protein
MLKLASFYFNKVLTMRHINSFIFTFITAAALSACGGTNSNRPQTTALLTANQVSVLNEGTDPQAVYDAVDGAKIATVSKTEKIGTHL